jgi:hypothetical protein
VRVKRNKTREKKTSYFYVSIFQTIIMTKIEDVVVALRKIRSVVFPSVRPLCGNKHLL